MCECFIFWYLHRDPSCECTSAMAQCVSYFTVVLAQKEFRMWRLFTLRWWCCQLHEWMMCWNPWCLWRSLEIYFASHCWDPFCARPWWLWAQCWSPCQLCCPRAPNFFSLTPDLVSFNECDGWYCRHSLWWKIFSCSGRIHLFFFRLLMVVFCQWFYPPLCCRCCCIFNIYWLHDRGRYGLFRISWWGLSSLPLGSLFCVRRQYLYRVAMSAISVPVNWTVCLHSLSAPVWFKW